ncbi:MAG TPA: caspase family protein [Fibrobacteria bacterium]|nr:caspase family protein [Fibrobacteria bacterium]
MRLGTVVLALYAQGISDVHRISLFIGMDQGLDTETKLKFASRDAGEMASLFRQTGLYQPDDIILVANKSLELVRQAMRTIESSAAKWAKQGSQTYLFVYFSGHGDAHSLHVRGQKLKRDDLVAWLTGLPCDLKIVVLDACESGDFLRSKGGRFLQDLPVRIDEKLKSRGIIIVSSTSRGELAQESDEYQGAVFTHHLANGLRGLADYNGDGWIGLQESFEYSRRATAMDMAMSGSLRQNPSFDLDLVGGSDPELIPIDPGKSWMLLCNFPTGTLDIHDTNSLDRISRVWLSGADSLGYRIPTGSYLFRFCEGGKEYLHTNVVGKTGGILIDRRKFQEKVRWSWVSKGGPAIRLNAFQATVGAPHPFPGVPMRMGRLDYVTRSAGAKSVLSFGIGKGHSEDTATQLRNDMDIFRLGYSQLYFMAGNRRLRLFAGGLASFNLVRQALTDARFGDAQVPNGSGFQPAETVQWANLYQLGAPFELEWAAYGRFWISAEALYSLYGYQDQGRDRFRVRFELEPYLHFGIHF